LDWSQLRYHHTAAVRGCVEWSSLPLQLLTKCCALSGEFLNEAKADLMSAVTTTRLTSSVKFTKELQGRALNKSEIAALMRILKADVTTGAGMRQCLLLGSGLRHTEVVVSLELSDFTQHWCN